MTLNYIIVEVDEAYVNEVNGIVVNSTIESVQHINRVATVIDAPKYTILERGDKVVIHHNILRLRNNMAGRQVNSNYLIEGNKYFVPLLEVFMYKRGNGQWKAIDPFVFVRPLHKKDAEVGGVIINADSKNSHKGNERLMGELVYINNDLDKMGVSPGDIVIFSEYSEYEFNIDGETLYKMSTDDILEVI